MFAALAALLTAANLSGADMRACLGWAVDYPAGYEKLKAGLSAAEWTDACRQAREANERRLSAVRLLRETGTSPVAGYSSATSFLAKARKASDPDLVQLFSHVAEDQMARESLSNAKLPIAQGLSPAARTLYDGLVVQDAVAADLRSRQWLKAAVARRGWFTIDRDGADADFGALLIVQHADADLAFKHEMLVLLEPLALAGRSRTSSFPQMYERWAVAAKAPQRFGLNGACKGPGVWEPYPVEDPDHVDERRAAFGMKQSLAEHVKQMSGRCS